MDIRETRIALRAKNYDRTSRFYEEVLGWPRLAEWSDEHGRGGRFQAGETVIEILGRPAAGEGGRDWDETYDYQGPEHKLSIEVVVPSAEKAYDELLLRNKNIPGGLSRRRDGVLTFTTYDPDGVHIVFRESDALAPERDRDLAQPTGHATQQEHGGTIGEVEWGDRGRGEATPGETTQGEATRGEATPGG